LKLIIDSYVRRSQIEFGFNGPNDD